MLRLLLWLAFTVASPSISAASDTSTTLLFVDDHDVLYRPGTRRVLHQPQRHEGNPILVGPTLRNQVAYCSVYRDPATGRYQMWYQISGGGRLVGYAESADGIKWTKPELDILLNKGFADRNAVLTSLDHYCASVVVDPAANDDTSRYKMAYWSIPPVTKGPIIAKDDRGPDGGMFVAFSPDGIHWTKQPGPVLRGSYGRSQNPPLVGEKYPWGDVRSVSDVVDASYDPLRKKFVVYSKAWIDGPDGRLFWKRAIARTESDDFVKWSQPQIVIAPDEFDGVRPAAYPGTRQGVQLHGAPVFVRHGVYFALLQVADFETHGLQPIELAVSRDGLTWSRPFRGKPFIPVGEPNAYDTGRIWSNSTPVVLDDEIRFYFGGAENPWHFGKKVSEWGSGKREAKTGIGLATLPLDRFAGLKPIEKIAQVTLRPRSLSGVEALAVNAAVAAGGSLRVELLDETGLGLPGFTKADAVPIAGDDLRHPVKWKSATLADLPDEPVTVRIHLDAAELFALGIE